MENCFSIGKTEVHYKTKMKKIHNFMANRLTVEYFRRIFINHKMAKIHANCHQYFFFWHIFMIYAIITI